MGIDQLQEQLQDHGLSDEDKERLQKKMDDLVDAIPDWQETKEVYSQEAAQTWEDIKDEIELEELQRAVEDAKAEGSDKLQELQEELKKARAAAPSLDDAKQQVSATWKKYKTQLPDLDDLKEKAGEVKKDIENAISDSVESWSEWFENRWNNWW